MVFKNYSVETHTDFLANFLPNGKLTTAKFIENSTLRLYLKGKAPEFKRLNDLFVTFINELDPTTTIDFLTEWESAIKIPDSCIPLASTDEERRENILLKLLSLSVQTEQDYIDLAAILGFTISFVTDEFPPYDVPFTPLGEGVDLSFVPPYAVPFTPMGFPEEGHLFIFIIKGDFDSNPAKADVFECLVKLLVPSTYRVLLVISS